MKIHEQNDSHEDLEKDPVWDLLKHSEKVDVSPFFSRNVIREIRLQEDQRSRGWILGWLGDALKQRATLTGLAVACVVLLFGVFQYQKENVFSPGGPVARVEDTTNEISEIDRDLASEIEAVEYLGQLMAVADPGELSDAALADLLF